MIDHFYLDVQGWFGDVGAEFYKRVVDFVPDGGLIVEVGVWKGRSTAFLGVELLKSKPGACLMCVDTFEGSNEVAHLRDEDCQSGNLRKVFSGVEERLRCAGLDVSVCAMSSLLAARQLSGVAHAVILDASHEYDDVVQDIRAWWAKLAPGGMLCGDDFMDSSVAAAVYDVIGKPDGVHAGRYWWVLKGPGRELRESRPSRVLLATPTHDCKVWVETADSIMSEMQLMLRYGVASSWYHYDGDSLVTRCRNVCAAWFMAHQEYTHLWWIDGDVSFPAGSGLSLLSVDKGLVCAPYPKKRLPITYVTAVSDHSDIPVVDGLLEVHHAGTGCMMIKREVFQSMRDKVPHLYGEGLSFADGGIPEGKLQRFLDEYRGYFLTELEDRGGKKNELSEDYAFCKRWRELGGKVYLHPGVDVNHFGAYTYSGRFMDGLSAANPATLGVSDVSKV